MKKLFKTLLACLLAFTCIASVATVSASATELDSWYHYQQDYYGEVIYDYLEDYLAVWCDDFFNIRAQNPLEPTTFVFVDDQLLNYGFVEHICNAINYSEVFAEIGVVNWDNLYQYTGIQFLVHYNDYTFYDLQTWVNTGSYVGYDFSDDNMYASLCSLVGVANMCAIGIWYPGNDLYSFLKDVQELWNDNLPIYFIYIDPITLAEDGLIFMVYDSLDKVFYSCDQAPGVMYQ